MSRSKKERDELGLNLAENQQTDRRVVDPHNSIKMDVVGDEIEGRDDGDDQRIKLVTALESWKIKFAVIKYSLSTISIHDPVSRTRFPLVRSQMMKMIILFVRFPSVD